MTGRGLPNKKHDKASDCDAGNASLLTITVPWSGPAVAEIKAVLHTPSSHSTMSSQSRDLLLTAIAKVRGWIELLVDPADVR